MSIHGRTLFERSTAIAMGAVWILVSLGCATHQPFKPRIPALEIGQLNFDPVTAGQTMPADERMARLTGEAPFQASANSQHQQNDLRTNDNGAAANSSMKSSSTPSAMGDRAEASKFSNVARKPGVTQTPTPVSNTTTVRAQSSDDETYFNRRANDPNDGSAVQSATYQYPELSNPGSPSPSSGIPSPNIGSPNELNPLIQPYERGGNATFPQNYADLDIYVQETQTGKINFGGAYNSDNGIVGQFIIDERNFDFRRLPRSMRDVWDGTAWRGGGQTFRLELVPGANLQRYLVSFSEPYFLNTDYSFSASGYFFQRQYFDWNENRLGGRFSLGRRLEQDISINAGLRLESVTIDNPRLNTSPELNASLGNSNLFMGNVGLVRDTRDNQFLATKGTYFSATYSQAFGDYSFARGDIDYRRYRLMYERPDGSGRHTLSYGTKLGFSGKSTPIFENYFAGGFSTLRGFDFRGAAPLEGGVRVGGEFQWLNTLEYMFPLTADDMIKGVAFCDFGTVEQSIEINKENFRVAPGFGFRIHMPAAGIGAPLAFDFAFPISTAAGDDEKIFSFYLGVLR